MLDLIWKQFLEVLGDELFPAKFMWWILVLVTNYNISKDTLAHICWFQVIVKNTMFKALSHDLQFKLKRPSLWTYSDSKSKKRSLWKMFCWRHSIPLTTSREISVLESLYAFITNFPGFFSKAAVNFTCIVLLLTNKDQ